MAFQPDPSQFELVEVVSGETLESDLDDMAWMMVNGSVNDLLWNTLTKNMAPDDQQTWIKATLRPRIQSPDIKTFGIREKGSGRLVAYTGLQYPMKLTTEQEKQQKVDADEGYQMSKGLNQEFVPVFRKKIRPASTNYGYDPTKHFHRRGTVTAVEFQRRGLAKWLTRYCNSIADSYAKATFVGTRPVSHQLFQSSGFEHIGTLEIDLRDYGGTGIDHYQTFRREPMAIDRPDTAIIVSNDHR